MTSNFITPDPEGTFEDQLNNCIDKLESGNSISVPDRVTLVLITFFIKASNLQQFKDRSEQIHRSLTQRFGNRQPAVNIISQDPEEGMELVLELIFRKTFPGTRVKYKTVSGYSYCVVELGQFKEVYGGVAANGLKATIRDASDKALSGMASILEKEGLHMGNVIRQWNYIERITDRENSGIPRQNYQIFNDIRTKHYNNEVFRDGYPPATGIGVKTGGVAIGFIAISESDEISIRPIGNPQQVNAHQYSDKVLTDGSTPKFERAKLVRAGSQNYFLVSGTAAITGELSLYPGDVEKQTIATIENINHLLSKENQKYMGLDLDVDKMVFSHLRVYVKHIRDIPSVKTICQSMLSSQSTLYLVSDICRDELLVEIEGIALLNHYCPVKSSKKINLDI